MSRSSIEPRGDRVDKIRSLLSLLERGSTAVLGSGQVSPPFAACQGGCAKDVCAPSDPTTRNCRNQNAPADCCLMPCPQCGKPYLLQKYTKRDGAFIACPDKQCGYRREAPEPGTDPSVQAQAS